MSSLDRRVTYATRRYFANKELRNRVNTRDDRLQDCQLINVRLTSLSTYLQQQQ